VPAEVVELAEERERARAARDFARSDELRDEIGRHGYLVRDTPQGFELVPRDAAP
jgi:cysteinyl-tRNA synthetase